MEPARAEQARHLLADLLIGVTPKGLAEQLRAASRSVTALTDLATRPERKPYVLIDRVAVIGVKGLLVPSFPYLGWDIITGYDALRLQLECAFADLDVGGVVLDVNSGGGFVDCCFDLARWLFAAKAKAGKPVAAICSSFAYSAAYALASQADQISVPDCGGVGSIGVYTQHWDYSGLLDKAGVKITTIKSGEHKADGHSFAPLSEGVAADWQAEIDDLRRLFAHVVAAGRGLDVAAVMATEARCYSGPSGVKEAVRLGLADVEGPPDQAFQFFCDMINKE
jgi:capsid assembly protease